MLLEYVGISGGQPKFLFIGMTRAALPLSGSGVYIGILHNNTHKCVMYSINSTCLFNIF